MTSPGDPMYGLRELDIKPGSVFVLNVPHRLSNQELADIKAEWDNAVEGRAKLLVLDGCGYLADPQPRTCTHTPEEDPQ